MLGCYRLLVLSLLLSAVYGCQSLNRRAKWRPPEVARPVAASARSALAPLETLYARALERESDCDASCVDDFFQAAALAWPEVEQRVVEHGQPCGRVGDIYHSCLSKLISAGTRFGRFDPGRGLNIQTAAGCATIPTAYHGFPRQRDDFDHLLTVGEYLSKDLNESYRCGGLGVAVVAMHCRRPEELFTRKQQHFAATVVLRPRADDDSVPNGFVLELFDPLRVSTMTTAGTDVALKRDLSAPLAYVLSKANRQYLAGFFQPGSTTAESGLFMIEPYQSGKIPVIFVHGLLSDPYTWANIANEIQARPKILERYQIWGYEYATGEPFLSSAALLRRQLSKIQMQFDPANSDAALSSVVLIGHSMGGLVAKLQVTHSGNQLWESVSCRSLDSIVTTDQSRSLLAEAFFFEPSPMVSRVVFIGTPHRGSPWARRPVGRLASKLVNESSAQQGRHDQLIRDNPHVFSDEFSERIPTSIDLLESTSPLLHAIDRLPHDSRVQLHTILGRGYWMCGAGSSDKVVPVPSARHTGVVTEKRIKAKHTQLHQDAEGVAEILCILRRHVQEFDAEISSHEEDGVSLANESMIDKIFTLSGLAVFESSGSF